MVCTYLSVEHLHTLNSWLISDIATAIVIEQDLVWVGIV